MSTDVSGDGLVFRMLLGELAESLSIPKLEPDANGSCHVVFDGRVAVELRHDAGSLLLFAALGRIADATQALLMPRLLQANLFWQGTAGATLGVSDAGLVVMAQRLSLGGLVLPALRDALERFVNTAQHWRNELDPSAHRADSPATRAPDMAVFMRA